MTMTTAEQDRWIPVSERLPEHGAYVLAWGNDWHSVGTCFYGTQEDHHHYCHHDGECKNITWRWHEDGSPVRHANVTHWMPLPAPPTTTDPDQHLSDEEYMEAKAERFRRSEWGKMTSEEIDKMLNDLRS